MAQITPMEVEAYGPAFRLDWSQVEKPRALDISRGSASQGLQALHALGAVISAHKEQIAVTGPGTLHGAGT